jgi:hypothetical protein
MAKNMSRRYDHDGFQAATPEQIASIQQLEKELKGIRSDLNALITCLFMYFPLPHIIHCITLRLPFFHIENMLTTYIAESYNSQLLPGVTGILALRHSVAPMAITHLNDEQRGHLDLLMARISELKFEETPEFLQKLMPYVGMHVEEMTKRAGNPDPAFNIQEFGAYTTFLILLSTTVNHLYNRAQSAIMLPVLASIRVLSFIAKRYIVDRLADKFFPLGIIPIGPNVFTEVQQLTFSEAQEVENSYLLAVNRYSTLAVVEKLIAGTYLVLYALYFIYKKYSPDTPNIDIQELESYDNILAPTFVSMLIIATRRSVSTIWSWRRAYNFNSTLELRFQHLQLLTRDILKDKCFKWEVSKGGTLERSQYILSLNRNLKLSNGKNLKNKFFVEGLEQVMNVGLGVLSSSNSEVIFSADYTASEASIINTATSLNKYCVALADLNLCAQQIKLQITKLLKFQGYDCIMARRTNAIGLPMCVVFLRQSALDILKSHIANLDFEKDDISGYRVYLNKAMDADTFSKLHEAFYKSAVIGKSQTEESSGMAYSSVNTLAMRKRGKDPKPLTVVQPIAVVEPLFKVKWSGGDIYIKGEEENSTVSAMYGRIVYRYCYFAKYNAVIKDPGLANAFQNKIKNGHVVGPEGEEGILVNEENRKVKDPHTGEQFTPEWKVKLKGAHGMYRLFGRVVKTVITDGKRRNLVEFSACVLTHT